MGNCVHSIQQRIELSRRRIEEAHEQKIDAHQKAAADEVMARLGDLEKAMREGIKNLEQLDVDIQFVESQKPLSKKTKTRLLFTTVATKQREEKRLTKLEKRYARALLRREVVYNTECDVKEARSDGRVAVEMEHMGTVAEKALKDMDIHADVKDKIQDLTDALQEDEEALGEENKNAHEDVVKEVTALLAGQYKPPAASAALDTKPATAPYKPTIYKVPTSAYSKTKDAMRSLQLA